MESSQFINQTRLSKKQLQLHVQQQNQKYFLNSPHDSYQQSRCQYFTSVTTPPSTHFPPPPEYVTNHHPQQQQQQLQLQQQNHCVFEQPSPSHRRPNIKKFHQSDPNSIEVCIDYENQHNNHVGGVDPSVSDVSNYSTFISLFNSLRVLLNKKLSCGASLGASSVLSSGGVGSLFITYWIRIVTSWIFLLMTSAGVSYPAWMPC